MPSDHFFFEFVMFRGDSFPRLRMGVHPESHSSLPQPQMLCSGWIPPSSLADLAEVLNSLEAP